MFDKSGLILSLAKSGRFAALCGALIPAFSTDDPLVRKYRAWTSSQKDLQER
jgi:hypothetical protein